MGRCRLRLGHCTRFGLDLPVDELIEPSGGFPDRLDARWIVDRVTGAVADQCRRLVERLCDLLRHPHRRRRLGRPHFVADHGGVARHPFDAAHHLGERHRGRRGPRRGIWRAGELRAEPGQLGCHLRRGLRVFLATGPKVSQAGDGRHGRRQPPPEVVVPRGRPHQHAGRDAEGGGERPTDQARTDGGRRLGHGDGKDEGEQGRRGRRGSLRCQDPGEEHCETHHPHRDDGRHLVRRNDGTEHGEAGTDEVQPAVGHEPAVRPPRELHQEEQREGTERPEETRPAGSRRPHGRWRTPAA